MKPQGVKVKKRTKAERRAEVRKQRILIGSILAFVIFYLAVMLYFTGHFYPGTVVNGTAVGGKNAKSASASLQEAMNSYELLMKGPEETEEVYADPALSMTITDDTDLTRILREQKILFWPAGFFGKKVRDAALEVRYDETVLAAGLARIGLLDTSKMRAPTDAHLEKQPDGSVIIAEEDEGTTLDAGLAKAQIRDAVGKGLAEVDLTESQVLPEIRSDNVSLVKREGEWNAFMKARGLTYLIGNKKEVLDGQAIAALLEDDGETVSICEEEVIGLMAVWREKYNTYHTRFPFVTFRKKEVTIEPYGDYGYELNDEEMAADLISRLTKGDGGTYEAIWYHKPLYDANNGLGGNYVEISIDEQRLWVWKDGQVVVDTSVVTGWPVHGSVTYHGCYAIKSKNTNVTLGEQDVQGYANPVSYWIPFNGGEGLHDAPWRDYFGGKIWLENGSHGCVNVPEEVMGEVYDNVEVGEAVVIYGKDYNDEVNELDNKEPNLDYYYDVYYGGE